MEREVVKLSDDWDAYVQRMIAAGTITGGEWIANFTGGDGNMYILRGDPQKLMALSVTPEIQQFRARAIGLNADWRMDFAIAGKSLDDAWPGWRQMVGA